MNTASKFLASTTLAAIALSAVPADVRAATTYSSILGYYTLELPSGTSAWTAGLVTKKLHQGAIAAVSYNAATDITTVTITGRDLSADVTTQTLDNHFLEILTVGQWEGLVFDIVSNPVTAGTGSSFGIKGDISGFGLGVGSDFCLRAHSTLGTLFPGSGGFDGSDILVLFDDTGAANYFKYDAGQSRWETVGGADATDEVLYPGQAFMAVTTAARTVMIGKSGVSYVKETPTVVPLYGDVVNLVGALNPLAGDNVTLGTLDLGLTNLDETNDFVITFATDGGFGTSGFFQREGFILENLSGVDASGESFPASSAVYVVATGAVTYWRSPAVDPNDVEPVVP